MAELTRLEQLNEFLKKEPDDPFLLYAIALEQEATGNVNIARKMLADLQLKAPDYTATYYHLGRLIADTGKRDEALEIYQAGMQKAQAAKQQHVLAELQSAYNNLLFDDE